MGKERARINYRHLIGWLLRKPGAFARYRYREELYPTDAFRRAHDVLQGACPGTKGDIQYLRVLSLAATTMESQVQAALERLLEEGVAPTADAVRRLLAPEKRPQIPELSCYRVDLSSYDELIVTNQEVSP